MKQKQKRARWAAILGWSMLAFVLSAGAANAAQPHTSYWFPDQLLKWSPAADKDAEFNKGTIRLAERFAGEKVNGNASTQPKLMGLAAMNPHTSNVPSQGSDQDSVDAFSFWQYVDTMVLWGGSSGEGIIVPPSADIIDAAHKNGVPIVGTVFFPPTAYGGTYQWVQQTLQQRPDGSFPVADKLIEAADYFGFDGWFINQETVGGNAADATKMQQFLKYMQDHKKPNMQVVWYDSMTKGGGISWQNALNAQNEMFLQSGNSKISDSMFINFNWSATGLQSSASKASSLGRSPYDAYAGIDVEANGTGSYVNWSAIFPQGQNARTSLGIYRPDWAYRSATSMNQFYTKSSQFWVGANGNPSQTNASGWPGMAHYFADKSSINSLPFTTNFNTGHGKMFAINGNVMRTKEWNNRSLQDVLPTWRWITQSAGTALTPNFDWDQAYYGGSSLKVSGNLNAQNATHLRLYRTALPVDANTVISVTYKAPTAGTQMKVALVFGDNPSQTEYVSLQTLSTSNWTTASLPLSAYAGRTITEIGLKFESSTAIPNFTVNIGELSVRNSSPQAPLPAVSNLAVTELGMSGASTDVRLKWDSLSGGVQVYEIYRVKPDGSKEFVNATPNRVYYIPPMFRIGNEPQTTLEVIALGKDGQRGAAAQVSFLWSNVQPGITNVALNRTATADTFVSGESPAKAVDGTAANNSKWCATGSGNHWLSVDLGSSYSITKFVVKHAAAGGESASFNTRDFKLLLSADGVNWADAVTVTGNTLGESSHTISATNARFAKLVVTKATQTSDTAARIYEMEVYGQ
ncbi:discoidin domain-containing protein [Paenibacillus sp. UMB4589-SE434]|uniref:endo-beta-N-acetylglucosaminidase n=1 Tax=Paenibacillus sp. UMB4589-SE434 TaxID=3046314 RepID=UPI00254DA322|nr:discoidin domain-containing protein [Paenibacillus sp. UMB4589-SE434]MDK8183863.1 discoidin domain-containing protein [Paenibacillus sp. UMB4589-SE434]